MKISSIIDNIPDKTQDKNTTSLEFKKDLIEYLGDVYQSEWEFDEDIQVVFIDCNHEISYVLSDIQNSINLCKDDQELLLIFDDYGLDNPWEGVKEAIQKYDDNPKFSILKEIGHSRGWNYKSGKFLREVEGVICKYSNKNRSYSGS